ncbi:25980_t:CDS:2, partial [Gigaspora margarita]
IENIYKTLLLDNNHQIHPFEEFSISTQHRKILKVAQQLKIEEEQFDISFEKFDKKSKKEQKETIVKLLDCG